MRNLLLPLACLALLGASRLADAQKYNAADFFNNTTNYSSPNVINTSNPFKYGSEALGALGSGNPNDFTLYNTYSNNGFPPFNSPIESWNTAGSFNNVPAVFYNSSGSAYDLMTGQTTIHLDPHQLALHPGSAGQYSIVRFTAQTTGLYSVSAVFNGADSKPTTTDVHVLFGGVDQAFAGNTLNLNGNGNAATYTNNNVLLTAGETVDFAVGYGNGDYSYDSTGLVANIAAVPELSTCVGFGSFVLMGGLAAARKRKRPA